MSDISAWSTTAASNNSTSPNGFPEGMAASGLNDSAREVMAAVRRWYEDAGWINPGLTPTRVSATQFTLTGDVTATWDVYRKVKMTGSLTAIGTISASTYSAPNTTITVSEANVPATLTTASYGILAGSLGYSLSAAQLLALILTVDGPGSGLDSDTVDGIHAASFQLAANYTAADVLAKLVTVDGTGSSLDADTVDGSHASAFAASSHDHASITGNAATATLATTATTATTAIASRNITGKTGVAKTLSSSAASGGSDGDIWYQY